MGLLLVRHTGFLWIKFIIFLNLSPSANKYNLQQNNIIMRAGRKLMKSNYKHSLPTHPLDGPNTEQIAKINLIELSHTDFLAKEDDAIEKLLEFEKDNLADDSVKANKICYNNPGNSESSQREDLINQFRKLTDDLEYIRKDKRYMAHSDRSYRFGDKILDISMRNPLATSNYVVWGCKRTVGAPKNHQTPPVSQYIIRQQRNLNKLRKSQSKYESETKSNWKGTKLRYSSKDSIGDRTKLQFNSTLTSRQL